MTCFVYEYQTFGGNFPNQAADGFVPVYGKLIKVNELDTATEKSVTLDTRTSLVTIEAYTTDVWFTLSTSDPGAGGLASAGTRQRIAAGGLRKDYSVRNQDGSQLYVNFRGLDAS